MNNKFNSTISSIDDNKDSKSISDLYKFKARESNSHSLQDIHRNNTVKKSTEIRNLIPLSMKNNTIFSNNTNQTNNNSIITNPAIKEKKSSEKKHITNQSLTTNKNIQINTTLTKAEKSKKEEDKLKDSLIQYYLRRKNLEELERIKLESTLPLFQKNDFTR